MLSFLQIKFSIKSSQLNPWEKVQEWMKLPDDKLKILGGSKLTKLRKKTKKYAQSELAYKRIEEISPIAKCRHSESAKVTALIIVTTAGALTFASAMLVFASNLGRMRVPAALVGGGACSFLVDKLATSSLTNLRRRQSAQKTIDSLARQKSEASGKVEANELVEEYYDDQISLVKHIEGLYLESQFPLNATLAGMLSAAEYVTAFWIVSQFGALGGIPIPVRAIAASLPVVLTYAASAIQSQSFGLPDHYHSLILRYQPYCFPPLGVPSDEVNKLLVNEECGDVVLDAGIQNILDSNPAPRNATPEMAELEAEIEYCKGIISQLERGCKDAVSARRKQFKADKESLADKFPGTLNLEGLSALQVAAAREKFEQEREKWLNRKLRELEKDLDEDILRITSDYEDEINKLNQHIEETTRKYEEAKRLWSDSNQEEYVRNGLGKVA
ncbi:MAG: hypothetical protein AB4426_04145 [Xenococcaceae cyanobacterium]